MGEVSVRARLTALLVLVWGPVPALQVTFADMINGWGACSGFYFPEDPSHGFLPLEDTALAQLIFSRDSTPDPVDCANKEGWVSGDDVLVDQVLIHGETDRPWVGLRGTEWGDFWVGLSLDCPPGDGYLFGRVFEDDSPDPGDRYYQGPVMFFEDRSGYPGPPVPRSYHLNTDFLNGDPLDRRIPDPPQTIPEPGTLVLMTGGILALFARCHFAKR